jgi:hypothetical protein
MIVLKKILDLQGMERSFNPSVLFYEDENTI